MPWAAPQANKQTKIKITGKVNNMTYVCIVPNSHTKFHVQTFCQGEGELGVLKKRCLFLLTFNGSGSFKIAALLSFAVIETLQSHVMFKQCGPT